MEETIITNTITDTVDLSKNVDFLLQHEKEKIEQEFQDKYGSIDQEVKQTDAGLILDEKPSIHKSKRQLIDDFLKLQNSIGKEILSEKKLKRLTKEEILKAISELANQVLSGAETPFVEKSNNIEQAAISPPQVSNESETAQKVSIPIDMITNSLFNMNLALCNLFESGSHIIKERTYNISLLEGYCKKIEDRKEHFLEIFKLIYAQYKVDMDKYLSPVVQYSLLMTQCAGSVIIENLKKKKPV